MVSRRPDSTRPLETNLHINGAHLQKASCKLASVTAASRAAAIVCCSLTRPASALFLSTFLQRLSSRGQRLPHNWHGPRGHGSGQSQLLYWGRGRRRSLARQATDPGLPQGLTWGGRCVPYLPVRRWSATMELGTGLGRGRSGPASTSAPRGHSRPSGGSPATSRHRGGCVHHRALVEVVWGERLLHVVAARLIANRHVVRTKTARTGTAL